MLCFEGADESIGLHPSYGKRTTWVASAGGTQLRFSSSLLQLRGRSPVASTPLVSTSGSTLCFSGEIFGGISVPADANDGMALLDALAAATAGSSSTGVPDVLSQLRGPWAVIFWDAAQQTLWFGRDLMGRRSLLVHWPTPTDPRFILTSVAPPTTPISATPSPQAPPSQGCLSQQDNSTPAFSNSPQQRLREAPASTTAHPAPQPADGSASSPTPGGIPPWEELPPGIYSFSFANGGLPAKTTVCQHDWRCPVLRTLAEFRRDARNVHPQAEAAAGGGDEAGPAAPVVFGSGATAAGQQNPVVVGAVSNAPVPEVPEAVAASELAPPSSGNCGTSTVVQTSDSKCSSSDSTNSSDGNGRGSSHAVAVAALQRAVCCDPFQELVDALLAVLQASVKVRCTNITRPPPTSTRPASPPSDPPTPTATLAPVTILFSGGVDSVLLAALAHRALPPATPLDLANVCFDGGSSPDRVAARAALEELAATAPQRRWRLVEVDAGLATVDANREHLLSLLAPAGTVMDLNIGAALWLATSATGHVHLPSCTTTTAAAAAASLGSSSNCNNSTSNTSGSAVCGAPRCCTGTALETTSSGEGGANVADTDAGSTDATSRSNTVLTGREVDEAEGLAEGQAYSSAAKVVLLGHGADEQCAGYGRHRTKFREGGWQGLSNELALDMRRMWLRNLGRDDRLVADWGKEARHPFLDESVMQLLLAAPLPLLADLSLPPGVGDKRILRDALRKLGLPEAGGRVKRAIQFGSRIGKLANQRDFGSGRAANKHSCGSLSLEQVAAARGQGGRGH